MRNGDGVSEKSVAGHDDDLLDEGLDECPALGQLALVEEVLHVLGVGRNCVHVVQYLPALGEVRPSLLSEVLKPLLPLPVFPDAVRGVGHSGVGRLDVVPDAPQFLLHVLQLILDGPKTLALLSGHAVHLLGHHLHEFPDVALREDVGADLGDDQFLESAGVERRSVAGVLAETDVRLTDVVGILAALGEPAG